MIRTSEKKIIKINCILFAALFIFAGCSTTAKQKKLLKVQQQRIKGLEVELQRKNKEIAVLKQSRWVNQPVKKAEALAIAPLKKLIQQKNWVHALQLSRQLEKDYPNSTRIAFLRMGIFKKMGLKKQAYQQKEKLARLKQRNRGVR